MEYLKERLQQNEQAQAFFYCLYTIALGYSNCLHAIYIVKSPRDDLMSTGGDRQITHVSTMFYGKPYDAKA